MKPFDLEAAKAGAKVVTRDGRDVRIVCFDRGFNDYPMLAVVTSRDGTEFVRGYPSSGNCLDSGKEHYEDLMMAPTKHEGWINIYPYGEVSCIFSTEEFADLNHWEDRVACVKIEWEE